MFHVVTEVKNDTKPITNTLLSHKKKPVRKTPPDPRYELWLIPQKIYQSAISDIANLRIIP